MNRTHPTPWYTCCAQLPEESDEGKSKEISQTIPELYQKFLSSGQYVSFTFADREEGLPPLEKPDDKDRTYFILVQKNIAEAKDSSQTICKVHYFGLQIIYSEAKSYQETLKAVQAEISSKEKPSQNWQRLYLIEEKL